MLNLRFIFREAVNDCNITVITDDTGAFDPVTNPGGWGGINPSIVGVSFVITRTGPGGESSQVTIVPAGLNETFQVCGWLYPNMVEIPDPCGCGGSIFYEPTHSTASDGCYHFTVKALLSGSVIAVQEVDMLMLCRTRKAVHETGLRLGSDCSGATNRLRLNQWARAWELFQSLHLLPSTDCDCAADRIEQIQTLLNGLR